MSSQAQRAAIDEAVEKQIQVLHPGPIDPNRTMGNGGYDYNKETLAIFLNAVSSRLLKGPTSYKFAFDASFVNAALGDDLVDLIAAIDDKTTT